MTYQRFSGWAASVRCSRKPVIRRPRVMMTKTWRQTASKKPMKTPKMALMTKTRIVRLRTCSRVGHVTFFSSDHDSVR